MLKFTLFAVLVVLVHSYSTQMAHDLAHMSSIAYESLAAINAWSCSDCPNFPVKNQKGFFSSAANIQGYAGYFPKQNAVLVSFRGSVDIKNWIYNIDTASVPYPACTGCAVHSGFYSAYKGVSPLVRTEVDRLLALYKTAKLIITGHSLGGAMAIHCALEMKQIHGKVDYVYTYGQPRVGNANFASFMQVRVPEINRVVDYADMVPHVPPSAFSFAHGGKQIWYTPRGMKTYKQCVSQDKTCSNSLVASGLSTDDHQIAYYMQLQVVSPIPVENIRRENQITYSDEEIKQIQRRRVQQIKTLIQVQLQSRQDKE